MPDAATPRVGVRVHITRRLKSWHQKVGHLERGESNLSLDLALRAAESVGLPVEAIVSRRPFAPMSAQLYRSSPG